MREQNACIRYLFLSVLQFIGVYSAGGAQTNMLKTVFGSTQPHGVPRLCLPTTNSKQVHGLCESVGARVSRDQNPADKSSKHQASPGACVMAEANAHMTAASSADADEAAMPNVTFSECHIASGLDVTH